MGGKKHKRMCDRCGNRHSAPTGKKCRAVNQGKELGNVFHKMEPERPTEFGESGDADRSASGTDSSGAEKLGLGLDDRITRLEALMQRMLELNTKTDKPIPEHFSDSSLSSGDELNMTASARRPSKKERKRFQQSSYVNEGELVNCFEAVVLIAMRTIYELLDGGLDPSPIYKHIEFMSKKSLQCNYQPETFVLYDACVRERAAREGVSAFGKVDQCETAMYFSQENMIQRQNRTGKSQNQARKKSKQPCWSYNDSGCQYKNCSYGHFCAICEEAGHGKRDCQAIKKKSTNK